MAENFNAPLLSPNHGSDTYQNQPVNQSINQQPQYAQPNNQPQYAQPINQPQYAQPINQQPVYGQPMQNQPIYQNQPVYGQPINQPINQPMYDPSMQYQQSYQGGHNQPIHQPVNQYQPVVMLAQSVPGQPGHIQTFGQWSDGLFDCLNSPKICLLSWFLPCYRWPSTVARLGLMSFGIAAFLYSAFILTAYICSIVDSALYPPNLVMDDRVSHDYLPVGSLILQIAGSMCGLVLVGLGAYHRQKIRARYQIVGSNFGDVCTYLWCSCCAIAQEARHVDRDYGLIV